MAAKHLRHGTVDLHTHIRVSCPAELWLCTSRKRRTPGAALQLVQQRVTIVGPGRAHVESSSSIFGNDVGLLSAIRDNPVDTGIIAHVLSQRIQGMKGPENRIQRIDPIFWIRGSVSGLPAKGDRHLRDGLRALVNIGVRAGVYHHCPIEFTQQSLADKGQLAAAFFRRSAHDKDAAREVRLVGSQSQGCPHCRSRNEVMSTSVTERAQRIVLRYDSEGRAIMLRLVNGSECGGQPSNSTLDRESAGAKYLRRPPARHLLAVGYFGVIVDLQSKIPQLSRKLVDSAPNAIEYVHSVLLGQVLASSGGACGVYWKEKGPSRIRRARPGALYSDLAAQRHRMAARSAIVRVHLTSARENPLRRRGAACLPGHGFDKSTQIPEDMTPQSETEMAGR